MSQVLGGKRRTDETKGVEERLKHAGFDQVEAYRYNSASIRVRVIDPRFEGMPDEQRDALVEAVLDQIPNERTKGDILLLLTLAPSEMPDEIEKLPEAERKAARLKNMRNLMMNKSFDDPEKDEF